jgi:glycosyltransferase involved in cell wall biosynthesis
VVCVAGVCRERARRVMEAVEAQTAAARIELVVVDCASDAGALDLPGGLHGGSMVPHRRDAGLGEARAAGVRRSTGPIVAFLVDHCYPTPAWAEALIDAYRGGWAAVGYSFESANPGSFAGRIAMLAQFGPWLDSGTETAVEALPGNNVSYRREALAPFSGELAELLDIDLILHERLRARGDALALCPAALVAYEPYDSLLETALANHAYSSLLAAARVRAGRWPLWRRLAYALASPLGVTAMRLAPAVRAARRRPDAVPGALATLPGVFAIAVVAALGEARGYLLGDGSMRRRFLHWELHAPRSLDAGADGAPARARAEASR